MFPAPESNGLMKKRSCSAPLCSVPCSPEPGALGVSPMCDVCALLLWLSCFFLQSSHLQWLSSACCGQCLVPVVVVGQSGDASDLS